MSKTRTQITFEELKTYLTAYLNGSWETLPFPMDNTKCTSEEEIANKYVSIISSMLISYFKNIDYDPNNRIGHLLEMIPIMQKNKDNESRFNILIEAIQSTPSLRGTSWKNLVLGIKAEGKGHHATRLKWDNNSQIPVQFPERFFKHADEQRKTVTIAGSNFVTSNPLKQHSEESLVLDASYCTLGKGIITFSVADGCGGHLHITPSYYEQTTYSDEEKLKKTESENEAFRKEDKNIARAAHFATKYSCRFFSVYPTADHLNGDMLSLIDLTSEQIARKSPGERTTLLCARAFPVKEGYRIVGFNIGDTALIALNPITKVFSTLLPARVTISDSGQEATAQVPDQYKHGQDNFYEAVQVDAIVPKGTLIFAISDGYLDFLPTIYKIEKYPNELKYRETKVDPEQLKNLFSDISEPITAELCADLLTQYVIQQTNQARLNMIPKLETGPDTQIGDDMALLAILLDESHEHHNTNNCKLL